MILSLIVMPALRLICGSAVLFVALLFGALIGVSLNDVWKRRTGIPARIFAAALLCLMYLVTLLAAMGGTLLIKE